MDEIKECLRHDYNLAVESYNNEDYSSFFRNIRPSIENLSQFLIFDICQDEMQALDLINGESSIINDRSGNKYSYSSYKANYKPTGRALPELFRKVYFWKRPDVYSSRDDETKKRLKRALESCCSELSRYYSIASEIGAHAGKTKLDVEIQARSCAAFMMGLFDFIRSNSVISESSIGFITSLNKFTFGETIDKNAFESELNRLIEETQEKDLALLKAQQLQNESELREQESLKRIKELEDEKQQFEEKIRSLKEEMSTENKKEESVDDTSALIASSNPKMEKSYDESSPFQPAMVGFSNWQISEDSMDDDQFDLYECKNDRSMLIAGCAGSGKSVIAMHKAEQLYALGQDVILIAYTKSLNSFMQNGSLQPKFRFFYYYQWKKMNQPTADYIIVDEIQDFTKEEIQEFMNAAKKHFLFFGDTAQSIYRAFGKNTMSVEEISKMTKLNILRLYNNYRLPRPIAKITQTYVGVNVSEYKEKVYQNQDTELPHFVHCASEEAQMEAIAKLLNENTFRSIGVLLPTNPEVLRVCRYLKENNIRYEFKYNSDTDRTQSANCLNFQNISPKVMTCHSAKGLQFDLVIIPFFVGATDDEAKKTLYVAMTRAMHSLYVLYSSPTIPYPLNVPSHLYLKE